MARSKKSQYTEKKERVIYLLLNPLTKEFFISHCQKKLTIDVFRHHYYGKRFQTKECIGNLRKEDLRPCLFILETINSTKVEAYNYVIVWTKIFLEAGYTNLNEGNILNYITDLHENNLLIYNERKVIDIKQKINCCDCLVVNYARKKCQLCKMENEKGKKYNLREDKKEKRFELRFTEEEFEQIKNMAKASGKTISGYIRGLALNMLILDIDTSCITEHTKEISSYRNAINQLIFTIKKTGNYTPADLEYIVNNTKEILKSEKEFLNIYRKSVESEKKLIARTIRKIVKENIKEDDKNCKTE